jgi:dihydroneopterin aldolase
MASKLALEIHNLIKKKIEEAKDIKKALRNELTDLVEKKADSIDQELMKYAGQIKDLKTSLEKMTSQTKTRALKCTVQYNKQAEDERQKILELKLM